METGRQVGSLSDRVDEETLQQRIDFLKGRVEHLQRRLEEVLEERDRALDERDTSQFVMFLLSQSKHPTRTSLGSRRERAR